MLREKEKKRRRRRRRKKEEREKIAARGATATTTATLRPHSLSLSHSLGQKKKTGCATLGLKLQTGPCSSAPTGLLHAFDSPDRASQGLSSSCDELSKLASPPPTAACCEQLRDFGAAGCACDAATLALAQMALGVSGDGMKAIVRAATAACSSVGVAVVDSCGGATC